MADHPVRVGDAEYEFIKATAEAEGLQVKQAAARVVQMAMSAARVIAELRAATPNTLTSVSSTSVTLTPEMHAFVLALADKHGCTFPEAVEKAVFGHWKRLKALEKYEADVKGMKLPTKAERERAERITR